MARLSLFVPVAFALTLAACGGKDDRQAVNALDADLTRSEDGLLLGDAKPGSAANPEVMKAAGGKLLQAPRPVKSSDATETPMTLGGLAAEQASKAPKRKCSNNVDYAAHWAQKLPEGMPVYPKGQVTEAAGETGGCEMRVVNFTTAATLQEILDFYYTRAVRSGYTAEHQVDGNDHMLGGTRVRDDGAFIVMARALPSGGTDVDLVTNNGR